MSGHSKWSTIKHKKAVVDAKRGAAFTKVAKKIQIAAKRGGIGDPDKNPFLRSVLEEAREINMPAENVKRAIDKALGAGDGQSLEEVIYEAYGPGGVGLMITCATDNRNRTGGVIKTLVEKAGGSLGSPGSVSYLRSIVPTPAMVLTGDDKTACDSLVLALEENDDVLEIWTNLSEDEQEN